MDRNKINRARHDRRKRGLRKRAFGTRERPRLSVYRSNKATYAQLIDDHAGHTVAFATSLKQERSGTVDAAKRVGQELAERAKAAGFAAAAFDRSGYKYHGRVRAVADGARENGLKF